jgi:hypothetical protein
VCHTGVASLNLRIHPARPSGPLKGVGRVLGSSGVNHPTGGKWEHRMRAGGRTHISARPSPREERWLGWHPHPREERWLGWHPHPREERWLGWHPHPCGSHQLPHDSRSLTLLTLLVQAREHLLQWFSPAYGQKATRSCKFNCNLNLTEIEPRRMDEQAAESFTYDSPLVARG